MNPINPVCRPATENEINYGEAKWCAKCTSECDNKGKDQLVMCDYFKTNDNDPIVPGCPSLMPHALTGGFDSVAPAEEGTPMNAAKMREALESGEGKRGREMSNEKQETIEDIVRELRGEPLAEGGAKPWLHYLADRIEAAAKREREAGAEAAQVCGEIGEMIGREATREKPSQVGNAAKMREALSDACYAMFNFLKTQNGGYEEMAKALDKAKAALAEPPRNCDLLSKAEVLEMLKDRSFSKEDTIEWLYSKAKGGAEWMV